MENLPTILSNPTVIWFLIGLFMLTAEFLLPGLIILFFGIGCWTTSLLLLIAPDLSINLQLTTFLFSSVLSLVLLRKSLNKWLNNSKKMGEDITEEYVGKHCIAETNFEAGGAGKVTFKGAIWDANSIKEIKKGDALIIKSVESIHLIVEPI